MFSSKKKTKDENAHLSEAAYDSNAAGKSSPEKSSNTKSAKNEAAALASSSPTKDDKPKLIFHCQLAHGSHTGLISGFSNVKELYAKIAECFEIPTVEVNKALLNNI
jgi:hypothetical protein